MSRIIFNTFLKLDVNHQINSMAIKVNIVRNNRPQRVSATLASGYVQ